MADSEPVSSPDQHKPTMNRKAARFGAIFTVLALLAMLFGNHRGMIEDIFLIGIAAIILGIVAWDWLLRKNGLKSD